MAGIPANKPTSAHFTQPIQPFRILPNLGLGGGVMRANVVEVENWTELGKIGQKWRSCGSRESRAIGGNRPKL